VTKSSLKPSIKDKALRINLNENIWDFAEIGAGQETVRHFLDLVVHLVQ
jgi:hypothetical protein